MDLKIPLRVMIEHYKRDESSQALEDLGIEVEDEITFFETTFFSIDAITPFIIDGQDPLGIIVSGGLYYTTAMPYEELIEKVNKYR
jgi:hypothetical protein